MVRLDTTRIVPFPAVPRPKTVSSVPRNEGMELLLMRDLAVMGAITTLWLFSLPWLGATRR